MNLLRLALSFAAAAWCSPATAQPADPACCSSCNISSSWPGFSGVKNVFSFGDSYTTTDFDPDGTQPSQDNPIGNPAYPGVTSASPAANWIDFLTTTYNQSSILTYNLAVGGSTVDRSLVSPFLDMIPTLQDQVYSLFVPLYNHINGTATLAQPWYSNDTLFAFWFGINDVNGSYMKGPNSTMSLNRQVIDVYSQILKDLLSNYDVRNFLILNVPPIDRSPGTQEAGKANQTLQKADLADFNGLLLNMVRELHEEDVDGKANFWLYDSNTDFTKVIDDPQSFPQTSLLKNTTECCAAYGPVGTPENDTFIASCGVPVNEYFWLNSLHPTYPIHEVVADQIASLLDSGPNMC